MLSSAFPSLRSATPGDIQEEGLPHLKHLVVFDDAAASFSGSGPGEADVSGRKPWWETRAAVDFREVLLWDENGREASIVRDSERTLEKDDVVNLQFTR